jgi:hypothetical protein
MQSDHFIRDLGDGLILRHAERDDAEALAQFDGAVFRQPESTGVHQGVVASILDLATRPHPTFQVGDFLIVEDTRTKRIVSSCNLISQTWAYEGVRFGVGRPEVVATDLDYRKRGLVRAQFAVLHQWSAARGELVQGITGIPYYYRQFGYEMAMPLGGGRSGMVHDIPLLKEGESDPFEVRPAVAEDLAFINELYEQGARRSLVYCPRSAEQWRYELDGCSPGNMDRLDLRIIQAADNTRLGFLAHRPFAAGNRLDMLLYELTDGVSWLAVTPSVLRYLKTTGEAASTAQAPFRQFTFMMGLDHPAYQVIPSRLPATEPAYAWYIRVPDLPAFICRLTPVLEQRIACSLARGYNGELRISFYRSGLVLGWEQGKLVKVEPWHPGARDWGVPRFPELTFLQLLFGKCTLEELMLIYPDCSGGSDRDSLLLRALFPRKASNVWPID